MEVSQRVAQHLQDVQSKVRGVEESLGAIGEKVRQVDETLSQIASAAAECGEGVSQISMAVSQMDKVTQGNAAGAEQECERGDRAERAGRINESGGERADVPRAWRSG